MQSIQMDFTRSNGYNLRQCLQIAAASAQALSCAPGFCLLKHFIGFIVEYEQHPQGLRVFADRGDLRDPVARASDRRLLSFGQRFAAKGAGHM